MTSGVSRGNEVDVSFKDQNFHCGPSNSNKSDPKQTLTRFHRSDDVSVSAALIGRSCGMLICTRWWRPLCRRSVACCQNLDSGQVSVSEETLSLFIHTWEQLSIPFPKILTGSFEDEQTQTCSLERAPGSPGCSLKPPWLNEIILQLDQSQALVSLNNTSPLNDHFLYSFSVKLSVAVCIGFFAAWSPYAVVSMWAAFGHIDNIPPLAFAMPAMFAKSSTIYNPIIYLTLRPNFRKVMARDLAALCHVCLRGCSPRCCSKPRIRFRFHLIHRQTDQFPPTNSTYVPSVMALKDHICDQCKDAAESFRHDPHRCGPTHSSANPDPSTRGDQDVLRSQRNAQALRCVCSRKCGRSTSAKQTSEIDNLHINLEMVPGHTKVAWPWCVCPMWMFTEKTLDIRCTL